MATVNSGNSNNVKEREEFTETDRLRQDGANTEVEIQLTFRDKIVDTLANITVEPMVLIFIASAMINMTAAQNLNLEKACRVNLNFTDEICSSLKMQEADSQNEYEKETQKLIARAMAWRTYLAATLPTIAALFVGSFSDKTGYRIVFLLIPITGQILMCFNNMLNVFFFYDLTLEVLVFTDAILDGLFGGWCICFLTAFAYVSAITTDKNRTFRLGLASFSMTVGFPIGMGTSGILLKKLGYYACFGTSTVLQTINLMYIIFMVKDPKRTQEQLENIGKGTGHLFRLFFNFSNVKATFAVVTRKAPNRRCLRLCVLLIVVCVLFGPMYGEISVLYLSTRYRFGWDEVKFSLFQTYNFITHTVGTIFSLVVFSKYLRWHDSLLGIISTLSKVAASFVYCFAANEKIFFIAPMVEILNGTSLLSMRSIISKLVEPNELGKVTSLVSMVENMMPLIYVPLYTQVYAGTMEVLPGAVFLMGAGMTLPAIIVLFYLFYENRKQVGKLKKEKKQSIELAAR